MMIKMPHFLIFLSLFGCFHEPDAKINCLMIQVSAALPIKVYLSGETAFNEDGHDGDNIEKFCFNQEFECDDEIKFQFIDADLGDYDLIAIDEDDNELATIPFESEAESDNTSVAAMTSWDDLGGSHAWTTYFVGFVAVGKQVVLGAFQVSNMLSEAIVNPVKGVYNFTLSAEGSVNGGLGNTGQLTISFLDEDDNILVSTPPINIPNSDLVNFPISLDSGGDVPVSFMIQTNNVTGSSNTIKVSNFILVSAIVKTQVYEASFIPSEINACEKRVKFHFLDEDENIVAFTELVNFSNSIAHNVQVRYKGIKPYAGLYYTPESDYFMTRIPGRFFHPRKSGQTTSMELSNNKFITTSTLLQKKRLFEIEDAPEYFHDMVELILNHAAIGSVKIREVEWERAAGDEYLYDEDTPDEYPLIRAEVVLSRKDWIKRNVI
jgi:hypothetical protein